ncbi:asparagine synthase-related protein [Nocardia terpenica]|uniref:asparagine synthase-related protein n=1 Tax=Nocardia terpenica TaxID=455432 RepID=UPI002F9181B7
MRPSSGRWPRWGILTPRLREWLNLEAHIAEQYAHARAEVDHLDHRLVEYVYNTPWSLKTFDGREKSLLRHAAKHVLPRSIAERVKSPYPSTQDPGYVVNLQQLAK